MSRRAAASPAEQLSLFDLAAPPPSRPDASVFAAQPAPPAMPKPAAETAPRAAPPVAAPLRHPQADREIRLEQHQVGYALRRSKRRSIGFIVGPEGLCVSAPKWVGLHDIEAALREKASWILRKLQEQQERARVQATRIEWRDGTSIPFLGDQVIIVLDPRATGAVLNADAQALPGVARLALHVGLPQGAAAEQIRDAVQSWLQRQARRVFAERCEHFARQLNVRVTRLGLSSAQTRWGSASADGSIRLNWRLIHFALPSIDYVVAHELAHLREMNHSARFWDVVGSVLPDYEALRGSLKHGLVPLLD